MHRSLASIALAALGLFASPSTATAEIITVCASGCDFTSIPDAIDAASAGDVIDIAAGTYTVDSQILLGQGGVDKPLTIIGETAADGTLLTAIQPAPGTRCFYIFGSVGPDTIIENLIITGGRGLNRGAGMYCKGDPTIINCHLLENKVNEKGAGMYNDGGNPTLIHCLFTGNSALLGGGAMFNFGNSLPILTNVVICDNGPNQIVGFYTDGGGNCISAICGSDSDGDGDGVPDCIDQCPGEDDTIDTDSDGTPDCLDGCENDPDKTEPGECGCGVPEDNCGDDITVAVGDSIADAVTAVTSGGTIVLEAGTHIVDGQILLGQGGVDKPLTIIGETAADGTLLTAIQPAPGTRCFYIFGSVGPDTIIENLIITGGRGLNRGAGMYCKGDPTIINCHLLDNKVNEKGAGMYNDGGNPTLIHCLFTGNSALLGGGAMFNFGNSLPILTNVVICDNGPNQIVGFHTDGGGNCISAICGSDSDGDGTPDCFDGCENDPDKTEPGECGCGVPDTDSDSDGTPDCLDGCENDPNKTEPGECGCGVPDTDSDSDGTPACLDGCENDPDKTEPGECGCGVPEDNCGDDITVAVGDSIADAVTAVASGGTIVLEAGTHIVDSQILLGQGGVDKPLAIIGETAADGTPLTSIQATSDTRCFYVSGHVGPDTIIENLIITGGSGLNRGAGIYCKGDPTIINCRFLDNAVAERGAGMYNDGGKPTLIHCLFTGNSAPVGGAMYNLGNSDPILTNVVICANSAPQISGDYTDGGGNCISDSCEDVDENGVPDECESCQGDLNADGIVNAADLGIVIGTWGTPDGQGDVNGDGTVNAADLGIVIGVWGNCP